MSSKIDSYEAVRDALHQSDELKINYYDRHTHEENIEWDRCPASVRESLQSYFERHTPTGGFLYAVLTNDLYSAFARADITNKKCLFDIVAFIYNEIPYMSYGDAKSVKDWLHE